MAIVSMLPSNIELKFENLNYLYLTEKSQSAKPSFTIPDNINEIKALICYYRDNYYIADKSGACISGQNSATDSGFKSVEVIDKTVTFNLNSVSLAHEKGLIIVY